MPPHLSLENRKKQINKQTTPSDKGAEWAPEMIGKLPLREIFFATAKEFDPRILINFHCKASNMILMCVGPCIVVTTEE